jgi:hypothetical protein
VTDLVTVLASSTNSNSTIASVEPGLLGFLVVAALAAALVFLLRSMNKQFKKIGPKPDSPEDFAAAAAAEEAGEVTHQRPLRGLAAHRAALAAAAAEPEEDAERD